MGRARYVCRYDRLTRTSESESSVNHQFRSALTKSALFLSTIAAAHGATYYVSTTGSDSNPGTASAPFQHVSKGVGSAVNPGDTVIVMNGTYGNEGVLAPNYVVTLNNSGVAGNPITIMAQNRGQAILDSGNTSTTTTCNGASSYFNLNNASFVVIQGFVIQHACDSGIQSNNAAHDITFRWNTIQYIANREVTDQYGRDGIYLNTSEYNFTFDGNIFHDIGRTSGITLMQLDHGIYSHAQNVTITNNVFYNMDRGYSIQLADGAANYVIANNTFAGGNADGAAGQIMYWGGNTNIAVENNIFYQPNTSALIEFEATISGSTFNNNIIYGVSSIMDGSTTGITIGTNQIGANPLFVNATSTPPNFELQSGSPAIAGGVALSAVSIDINGVTRANPPDIGAYQFVSLIVPTTFSLSSLSTASVTAGQTVTVTINGTLLTGSAASVAFSVSGEPAGTVSFSNTSCTLTCSTILSITPSSTASGTYSVIVTGTGAGATASTSIALTVNAPAVAPPPVVTPVVDTTSGLMARWLLNATSGTVAQDSSPNGNTGKVVSGSWSTKAGRASLSFSGNKSYVSVKESSTLEANSALTVSFWIYANATSNVDPRVVSKLYDWDVKLNNNRYPQFDGASGQYAQLGYALPLQAWHHIAFTFANGTVTGYVDGAAAAFQQNTFTAGGLAQYAYGLNLGTDPSVVNSLAGSLSDVRLYNRALTAAEIASVYAGN